MRDRIRGADIDDAAEDPPLLPLAGAALGVLLAGGGLPWVLLSSIVDVPFPIGSPPTTIFVGIVLFVVSMLAWSPEMGYS